MFTKRKRLQQERVDDKVRAEGVAANDTNLQKNESPSSTEGLRDLEAISKAYKNRISL